MPEPDTPNDEVFYGERRWHFPNGFFVNDFPYENPENLAVGELVPPDRRLAFQSQTVCTLVASQMMQLHYFTARKTQVVNSLETYSGTTAAGATPTLAKVGLFEIADNGDGNRIGISANDTALWSVANTAYNKPFTASAQTIRGRKYAMAALIVTAAAIPSLHSSLFTAATLVNTSFSSSPRLTGAISGQADIPTSFLAASVGSGRQAFTGLLLP